MAYTKQLPKQPGYYWVRGECGNNEIECIVHVDRVLGGELRTNVPHPCDKGFKPLEMFGHMEWSGPIDRPEYHLQYKVESEAEPSADELVRLMG